MASLTLEPIGVIRTPYDDRYRAPRQPGVAESPREGLIELVPGQNFEQALDDLAGFERVWVISHFHRNRHWKPRVLPPRSRVKRGLFATRSPHRPNPLGLSLFTVLEIRGRTLRVGDVDLLDETPVFDLKPYIPYAEAFPGARAGWVDEANARDAQGAPYAVGWSPHAAEQAAWLLANHGVTLGAVAVPVLTRDPFPHPYRRIERAPDGGLVIAEKSWRLYFSVTETAVEITRVASGYPRATAFAGDPAALHQGEAHRAFHLRYGG